MGRLLTPAANRKRTMRCFVAIDLAGDWRTAIGALLPADGGGGGVRWVSADSLHITLWFLGDVAESAVPAISDGIARVSRAVEPFEFRIGAVGCFPSRHYPRVLWIGVEDPAEGCRRWLAAATPIFAALGFLAESRPFHAHITLARSRDDRGAERLRAAAGSIVVPSVNPLRVRDVVLFESQANNRGVRYRPIATSALGARR